MNSEGKRTLRLPEQDCMVVTNQDDPVDYYYKPLTGWLYRRRLEIGLALLGDGHHHRILEIGYGSGILLPTLAVHCDELYGVDIHENVSLVEAMLTREGIHADLSVGDILILDYPDQMFDAVICLSVLEHLVPDNLPRALAQILRVLQPGGVAVLGFPVRNAATSAFYRLVGFDPNALHPSGHREIVAAARASFAQTRVMWFPHWLPMDLALYVGVRGEQ